MGSFSYLSEGEKVALEGEYTAHATYGEQFKVEKYEILPPEDEESMERYLGSGAIKGVGAALAARIVRRFGRRPSGSLRRSRNGCRRSKGSATGKPGRSPPRFMRRGICEKAMIFLQQYGISSSLGVKIYQRYGGDIYHVIQENPYQLADDISGVGFRIADEIAKRAGIQFDSEYRIKCGIFYVLQQSAAEGHIYLPREELLGRTVELLGVTLRAWISTLWIWRWRRKS